MQEKRRELPDLQRYSDVPLFNTKAVVQQTGIAAPTLRAWERRYAILEPVRASNAYRLYSERDIAIIRWLKEHVDAGISISQAIALYHHLIEEQNQSEKVASLELYSKQGQESEVERRRHSSPATYEMRVVQEGLLEAFSELDEAAASRLMSPVLAIYSIEQVCTDLITPTLWEVGRRWEHGRVTVSVEHFASAFFQGILINLFHALPPGNGQPLVITCCAPGEEHAIAPLMLALLLRRAGLHVAYLGQSIETAGLLQTARQLSPAVVCVSITMMSCLDALIDLGREVEALAVPRPAFILGGQLFERHPEIVSRVPGRYLGGEMQGVVPRIRHMAYEHVGLPFS